MTSIPLKPNSFIEKITNLHLVNISNGNLLSTLNNFDLFPGTVTLFASLDFFNIKANTNYILSVTVNFPNGDQYPVHATRVNIPEDQLTLINADGYGKATGNFQIDLTTQYPSDFYLLFTLLDEQGEALDTYYSYHNFGKQ